MDASVVRFTTALFDVARERPNPINPIFGESLLLWIAEKAKDEVAVPIPDAEDWGWYADMDWKGRSYMLGASAADEEQNGQREWVLQIWKRRSVKERLLGQERMTGEDECVRYFRKMLERETSFSAITPG